MTNMEEFTKELLALAWANMGNPLFEARANVQAFLEKHCTLIPPPKASTTTVGFLAGGKRFP